MKSEHLGFSYELDGPANWRGTYTSNNGNSNGSWSWYKGGDPILTKFPHITVTMKPWETNDINGVWCGFHVSVPHGGVNYRYNYHLNSAGVVEFANTTTVGFRNPQAILDYGNANAVVLNEFAKAFVKAAQKTELLRVSSIKAAKDAAVLKKEFLRLGNIEI